VTRSMSLLLMLASLCAGAPLAAAQEVDDDFDMFEEEFAEESATISDPLRGLNRIMFNLNDKVYFSIIKPVAQKYKQVTPRAARISMRNFFHNLAAPGRFANCVLQGKGKGANTEFKRFMVNSTVGILGFADPATEKMGLEATREDLGQTLATYGFGNGFYIVWPVFGPSTLRDSIGRAGDILTNPLVYVNRSDAFLTLDGCLVLLENVAGGLTVNPAVVKRNLTEHLPFMATETILMHAASRGGDRQQLHERMRRHSIAAAKRMNEGEADVDLLDRIADDEAFGLSRDDLVSLTDADRFVGRAPEQVARFLEDHVAPTLARQREDTVALADPDLRV